MQDRYVGGIGDFGKLALLRHLMEGRRLAVCWYLTSDEGSDAPRGRHFDYLGYPDKFRHFAPEVFDSLKDIVEHRPEQGSRISALESSGLLGSALFHRKMVPERVQLRPDWASELVQSVDSADLVFLDPNNGIQGTRLTQHHAALAELAALKRQDRILVVAQRPSGHQSHARTIADHLQTLGCERIELIRFRLVSSRFYIVADHDEAMSMRIASFAKKWGNWVKTYRV